MANGCSSIRGEGAKGGRAGRGWAGGRAGGRARVWVGGYARVNGASRGNTPRVSHVCGVVKWWCEIPEEIYVIRIVNKPSSRCQQRPKRQPSNYQQCMGTAHGNFVALWLMERVIVHRIALPAAKGAIEYGVSANWGPFEANGFAQQVQWFSKPCRPLGRGNCSWFVGLLGG